MPSIIDIQRAVCRHWGLTIGQLIGPGRPERLAWPRQVSMALCHELTHASQSDIARRHGRRDHTTARYAYRRVAERERLDAMCRAEIDAIRALVRDLPAVAVYGTDTQRRGRPLVVDCWRSNVAVRFGTVAMPPEGAPVPIALGTR